MCKMEWFEEQRSAKQAAVDNAVKLTTAEWRAKLDAAVEQEVETRLEEGELSTTDNCLKFLDLISPLHKILNFKILERCDI